eukprot:ANDGO_00583.mRNA.1 hypothetical protein
MGLFKVLFLSSAAVGTVFAIDVSWRVYDQYGRAHLTPSEYAEKFSRISSERWDHISSLLKKEAEVVADQGKTVAMHAKDVAVEKEHILEQKAKESFEKWTSRRQ